MSGHRDQAAGQAGHLIGAAHLSHVGAELRLSEQRAKAEDAGVQRHDLEDDRYVLRQGGTEELPGAPRRETGP